ncbi:MAG: flagellar basal body-associated FliL family protein [Dehalococcoidia bacterium]
MSKGIIMAIAGALLGVVVAFAAFTFLSGGTEPVVAEGPPEVVSVPGKLGPHITLADRVFNLLPDPSRPETYLKLQTVIEFETTDERWLHVLTGCGAHAARFASASEPLVSLVPAGRAASPPSAPAPADPCDLEHAALLAEFEHEIGTGRSLIEDAVTSIISGHTASEVGTPAGKEALKAEIRDAVEHLIEEPHVTRVLFLNFITQ